MSEQHDGTPSESKVKTKGGEPYGLVARKTNKTNGKPLSGYALDLTIRVNGQGAYFLQDHNGDRVMPHNNREELSETLFKELQRHHVEHFGKLQDEAWRAARRGRP